MLEGENLKAMVKRCKFVGTLKPNNEIKDLVISVPQKDYEELRLPGAEMEPSSPRLGEPLKGPKVRAVIVWSEGKASRDARNRKKRLGGMLRALKKIKEKLNTRRYKNKNYVREQIKKVVKRGVQEVYPLGTLRRGWGAPPALYYRPGGACELRVKEHEWAFSQPALHYRPGGACEGKGA